MIYQEYIRSDEWRRIAHFVRRDRNWTCHDCLGLGHEVHHADYRYLGDEWHHLDSLVLLCRDCHLRRHPEHQRPTPHAPIVTVSHTPAAVDAELMAWLDSGAFDEACESLLPTKSALEGGDS